MLTPEMLREPGNASMQPLPRPAEVAAIAANGAYPQSPAVTTWRHVPSVTPPPVEEDEEHETYSVGPDMNQASPATPPLPVVAALSDCVGASSETTSAPTLQLAALPTDYVAPAFSSSNDIAAAPPSDAAALAAQPPRPALSLCGAVMCCLSRDRDFAVVGNALIYVFELLVLAVVLPQPLDAHNYRSVMECGDVTSKSFEALSTKPLRVVAGGDVSNTYVRVQVVPKTRSVATDGAGCPATAGDAGFQAALPLQEILEQFAEVGCGDMELGLVPAGSYTSLSDLHRRCATSSTSGEGLIRIGFTVSGGEAGAKICSGFGAVSPAGVQSSTASSNNRSSGYGSLPESCSSGEGNVPVAVIEGLHANDGQISLCQDPAHADDAGHSEDTARRRSEFVDEVHLNSQGHGSKTAVAAVNDEDTAADLERIRCELRSAGELERWRRELLCRSDGASGLPDSRAEEQLQQEHCRKLAAVRDAPTSADSSGDEGMAAYKSFALSRFHWGANHAAPGEGGSCDAVDVGSLSLIREGQSVGELAGMHGSLFRVAFSPFVATRRVPRGRGEVCGHVCVGEVVALGAADATGRWRQVLQVAGRAGAGRGDPGGRQAAAPRAVVGSWVPMEHPAFGDLLRPIGGAQGDPERPQAPLHDCQGGVLAAASSLDTTAASLRDRAGRGASGASGHELSGSTRHASSPHRRCASGEGVVSDTQRDDLEEICGRLRKLREDTCGVSASAAGWPGEASGLVAALRTRDLRIAELGAELEAARRGVVDVGATGASKGAMSFATNAAEAAAAAAAAASVDTATSVGSGASIVASE